MDRRRGKHGSKKYRTNIMNPLFWKNKRVFVTGHTGFKGRWLTVWLTEMGAHVDGFSLEQGDIRDLSQIKKAIVQFKPDILFHLAAQSLVQYSYEYPVETYSTNVMGTVNVLESVRECATTRVVINVTSDKCYDNKEWVWPYREHEALGGHDPYSNSKACSELVTSAYRHSFLKSSTIALASARAGNVIGGGDWSSNRLIPDLMRAFTDNTIPVIRHPDAIRPWQHVLDALGGYLLLAEKCWEDPITFSESWNFGPSDQDIQPVQYLADKIVSLWGNGASWVHEKQDLPHEAHILKLDSTKARTLLNWSPVLTLEKSIQYCVDWYKAADNISLKQIRQYEREKHG